MIEYILNIVGVSYDVYTYAIDTLGIKRADIINGMTKDEFKNMKDADGWLMKL